MKDLQGKWRDKCSIKDCLCKEYRVEGEKKIRCDYCNHTPAEHCWRGRCKNPECEKEYEQAGGGCQEYEEDEDEVESCGYCSHKKEEHTLMKSPCQPSAPMAGHVGSTPAASGPKCKVPGCTKPCFMEPNGHVHDYCSRRHAQAAASSDDPMSTKPEFITIVENVVKSESGMLRILKWESVCRNLGVESKDYESIKLDHPNRNVRAFEESLRVWHKGNTRVPVTWKSLFEALQAAGEKELVRELMKKLNYEDDLPAGCMVLIPETGSQSVNEIGAVENLLPYIPYFLAHLDFLGTVLGIGNHAQAIVQGSQSADSKCLQILNIWLNNCPNATWKMFCDALKKYDQAFADVRVKIQRDHRIGEDRFQEDYRRAVEAHGCIELTITKCTTIGPQGIGKTCLKHLLTNTRWDAGNVPSTEAIRAPEWVECFRGETNSTLSQQWKTFNREERIQALLLSIKRKEYAMESASNTAEVQPTEPTKATMPTPTASKPGPFNLAVAEQMVSEAATPKSDPTATEEYKLLVNKFSSLIPDKLQEDEKKKGQILHKMQILHFIDTGGQSEYHDVHPVLITSPSVYLVVFSLEKCFPRLQADFLSSDLTQQALRSIHTLTSEELFPNDSDLNQSAQQSKQPVQPKIFIVGTHLDKIPRCSDVVTLLSEPCLDALHTEIETKLNNMPYCNYIQYDPSGRCFWAVSNLEAGKETADEETATYLAHLRELTVEESMTMTIKLPITWLILEYIAVKCQPIFQYNIIFQMAVNKKLVAGKEEFDALLQTFHRLGLFFYEPASEQDSSNYVFVDPNELYTLTSKLFQRCITMGRQPRAILTKAGIKNEIAELSKKVNSEWLINLLCKLRLMAVLANCQCVIPAVLPDKPLVGSHDSQCVIPAVLPDKPLVGSLLFSFISEGLHQFSFLPSGLFCAFTADIIRTQPEGYSWTPIDMYRHEIVFNVKDVGHLKLTEYHSTIKIDLNLLETLGQSIVETCQGLKRCLHKVLKGVLSGFYCSKHKRSDFDSLATWGVTCPYHRDGPKRMQHLAECIFNPMSQQWYSVCTSSPTGLFHYLSKEEEVWFRNS